MGFILAHAVFRTLKHELKDFHRGRIAKVQILSLKKEKIKLIINFRFESVTIGVTVLHNVEKN